jgi:hypothetical protein
MPATNPRDVFTPLADAPPHSRTSMLVPFPVCGGRRLLIERTPSGVVIALVAPEEVGPVSAILTMLRRAVRPTPPPLAPPVARPRVRGAS